MRRSPMSLVAAFVLVVVPVAMAQTRGSAPPVTPDVKMPAGNIEHGRYIAEHVAMCVECHSERDGAGRIIPGHQYMGGTIPFVPPFADWATRVPRNKGLAGYTDAQAMRLLTQGAIGRDGVVLKSPMPRFRMSAQDAADVIAFLRSLN